MDSDICGRFWLGPAESLARRVDERNSRDPEEPAAAAGLGGESPGRAAWQAAVAALREQQAAAAPSKRARPEGAAEPPAGPGGRGGDGCTPPKARRVDSDRLESAGAPVLATPPPAGRGESVGAVSSPAGGMLAAQLAAYAADLPHAADAACRSTPWPDPSSTAELGGGGGPVPTAGSVRPASAGRGPPWSVGPDGATPPPLPGGAAAGGGAPCSPSSEGAGRGPLNRRLFAWSSPPMPPGD